jgi:prepilin-type N-terminal cleavage/methylation domain-containing protein
MTGARAESGFSLVEMITVMAILGVVLTGLTTLFVQGSNAEIDMNNRFQAQVSARVGLDKLRRELHCASGVATTPTNTSVQLFVPCVSGGQVNWCSAGSGSRYALYRTTGATACSSSATKFVDYLTTGAVFWYDAPWTGALGKLHVDLKINVKPTRTVDTYELCDVIALRNSVRKNAQVPTVPASPAAPC